jgi:hypothetical protein
MSALEDHFDSLSGWLRSRGVPAWDDVLFAEDLSVSPFSKQQIEEGRFHSLEGFAGRFDELLNEGHNWLNLSGLGLLDGSLIVAIEKPRANAGSPTTSVNQSGPPNCVKDERYSLERFIEIVKSTDG